MGLDKLLIQIDGKLKKFEDLPKAASIPTTYKELREWREGIAELQAAVAAVPTWEKYPTKYFEKSWTTSEVTALVQQARALPNPAPTSERWAVLEIIPGVPGKIIAVLEMDGISIGSIANNNATLTNILYSKQIGQFGYANLGMVSSYYADYDYGDQGVYQHKMEAGSNQYIDDVAWGANVGSGIWQGSFNQPADLSGITITQEGEYYVRGSYIEIDPPF